MLPPTDRAGTTVVSRAAWQTAANIPGIRVKVMRILTVLLSLIAVGVALVVMWTAQVPDEPAPVELSPPSPDAVEDELMAADRAFAADTAERGIDGWMAWMAPDAARTPQIGGELVGGAAAIRALDEPNFAREDVRLIWEPTSAHAYDGGHMGLTTGRYELVSVPDGAVMGTGHYVSVWRRGPDGWRVIFDTGAPEG